MVNPCVASFLRQVGDQILTFQLVDNGLTDLETGSRWDPVRGMATAGPLQGEVLRPAPYIPAFRHSWQDFHPDTEFYP